MPIKVCSQGSCSYINKVWHQKFHFELSLEVITPCHPPKQVTDNMPKATEKRISDQEEEVIKIEDKDPETDPGGYGAVNPHSEVE